LPERSKRSRVNPKSFRVSRGDTIAGDSKEMPFARLSSIVLVPMLALIPASIAAQTVSSISGAEATISFGSAQGVSKGMTGRLCTDETVGEVRKEICDARFEVTTVRESSSTARVTKGDTGLVQVGYRVRFDQALTAPRNPQDVSRSERRVATAEEILARGNRLFDVKDWTGAAAAFQEYLNHFKDGADAGYAAKLLAASEERIAAARAEAEAQARLASAAERADELARQAQRLITAGEWLDAKGRAEEALGIDPSNTAAVAALEAAQSQLGPPPHFAEPESGIKFVLVPSGVFQMGCTAGDQECSVNETPPHSVTISRPFYMAETETTIGQYRKYSEATGQPMPPKMTFLQGDDSPVVAVNWTEAKNFCGWVGGRLPTEAEWEYAARGGLTGARFPSGNSLNHDHGNYSGRGGRDQWDETGPVASFPPNGFGLYDMAGNAAEWVNDWFAVFVSGSETDPIGPVEGLGRVFKTGGIAGDARSQRVSTRGAAEPGVRGATLGFRCARRPDLTASQVAARNAPESSKALVPLAIVDLGNLRWTTRGPASVNLNSGYCEELEIADSSDWRLPSVDELKTLIDLAKASPEIHRGEALDGSLIDYKVVIRDPFRLFAGSHCGWAQSVDEKYERYVRFLDPDRPGRTGKIKKGRGSLLTPGCTSFCVTP